MHPRMVFDTDECVEFSALPDKITAIIPTQNAPIECLLWSIFSLLLRAKPNDLIEHFCVCINGPDDRTGNTELQDRKQEFLEELREMKWYHKDKPEKRKDMPITIIRAWSRIGHPEAVEMATPWVHTDAYLLMHDDIIIRKHEWLREVKEKFYDDPDVAIAYSPQLLCALSEHTEHAGKNLLRFPHILCSFLICRRKWIIASGQSWCGFHIPCPTFNVESTTGNYEEFIQHYKNQNNGEERIPIDIGNPPRKNAQYDFISMEMGAWLYYHLCQQGRKFTQLDPTLYHHFGTMSWDTDAGKSMRVSGATEDIKNIEKEILEHPDYGPLYQKYIKGNNYYGR